jgi:hypothetical protein
MLKIELGAGQFWENTFAITTICKYELVNFTTQPWECWKDGEFGYKHFSTINPCSWCHWYHTPTLSHTINVPR